MLVATIPELFTPGIWFLKLYCIHGSFSSIAFLFLISIFRFWNSPNFAKTVCNLSWWIWQWPALPYSRIPYPHPKYPTPRYPTLHRYPPLIPSKYLTPWIPYTPDNLPPDTLPSRRDMQPVHLNRDTLTPCEQTDVSENITFPCGR